MSVSSPFGSPSELLSLIVHMAVLPFKAGFRVASCKVGNKQSVPIEFRDIKDVSEGHVGPFSLSARSGEGTADACRRDGTLVTDGSAGGRR